MVPKNGTEKTSRFVYLEDGSILKLSPKVEGDRLLESLEVLSNQAIAVLKDIIGTNRRNGQPICVC